MTKKMEENFGAKNFVLQVSNFQKRLKEKKGARDEIAGDDGMDRGVLRWAMWDVLQFP
ncbi:MAG: hypothetical protein MUF31_18845 [Akkermansiaceae bacterium]|jgi:hypothetical protein|nr:hypothetical protein [Akkermansiaceae bacterium]